MKHPCYEIYCLNYHADDYVVYRNNSVAYSGTLPECIAYVQAAVSGLPKEKPSLSIELFHGLFTVPSIIMLLTWFVHYVTSTPDGFRAGLVSYLVAAGASALLKALLDFVD
jgi:hypothetical protein